MIEVPRLRLEMCPTCGRIRLKRWVPFNVNDLAQWVRRQIRVSADSYTVSVSIRPENGKLLAVYTVVGEIQGVPFRVFGQKEMEVVKKQCPECSLKAAGYYEAVIQLRGDKVREMLRFLRKYIESCGGPKAFIARVEEVRGGFDVYVGSRKIAEKAVRRLRQTYNAEVKRSYTLVGERDGRRIYRETLSVRA